MQGVIEEKGQGGTGEKWVKYKQKKIKIDSVKDELKLQ